MPDHPCPHAQDIGAMKNTVDKIDVTVNGNGGKGLKIDVDRLKISSIEMHDDLKKIATGMSALAQARDAEIAIAQENEKNKSVRTSALKAVGIVFSIIFGGVGLLYVILDHISNH